MLKIFNTLDYKQKINFFIILSFTFLVSLLEIFNLSLVIPIIGILFDNNFLLKNEKIYLFLTFFPKFSYISDHLILIIFFLSVFILKTIFFSIIVFYSGKFSYITRAQVSQKLLTYYIHQDYVNYRKNNTTDLINIIKNEVAQFGHSLLALVNIIIHSLIFLSIFIFILLNFYFLLILLILVIIFFSALYILIFNKSLVNLGNKRFMSESIFLKDLTEILSAFKEIKIYKREKYFINIFGKNNYDICKIGYKWSFIQSMPKIYMEFLFVIILFIVIFVSNYTSQNIVHTLIPLGVISFGILRILPSLNIINNSYQTIIFNSQSCDRINRIINKSYFSDSKDINAFNFKNFNTIIIQNLSFSYEDNLILDNINLEIKKGDILGIVGESGSGKSTFVEILTGLINTYKGNILVDSKNINADIRSWQKNFGYIPQKIYLLNDTIKNNIIFGNPIEDLEKINKILSKIGLEQFISNLKNGLETVAGENGSFLSGGQAQRICIARALYNDPSILIFDESTNALDIKNESELLNYVKNLSEDITIIVISHRLETLKICNKIFKIENRKLTNL